MFDIRSFCRTHSVQFAESGHHHTKAGWLQVKDCPFCGSHNFHLGFSLSTGAWNCWRCGKHGLWAYIGRILKTNDSVRIRQIVDKFQTNQKYEHRQIVRKKECPPPPGLVDLQDEHKRYLKKRGFDPDLLVEEWNLKGTTWMSGNWGWRVVAPIYDVDANVVAYTGRAIQEAHPQRYKTTENESITVDPNTLAYGIHRVDDSVVIVEGPTGVWRIGPGAVAGLGMDWKLQFACIVRRCKKRFILFDPEPEAQSRAEKLAEWLSFFPGDTEILSGFKTDPGEMSESEVREIRSLL